MADSKPRGIMRKHELGKRAPKTAFKFSVSLLDDLYNAQLQLYHTIRTHRPDELLPGSDAALMFTNTIRSLLTYRKFFGMSASTRDFMVRIECWDGIVDDLNMQNQELVGFTIELIGKELEKVKRYIDYFKHFKNNILYKHDDEEAVVTNTEDEKFLHSFTNLDIYLRRWSNISTLFLQHRPELLNIEKFFVMGDAIYLFWAELVRRIISWKEASSSIIGERLNRFARGCTGMGYIGPVSHLIYHNNKPLRPKQVDTLKMNELLERLEVDTSKLDHVSVEVTVHMMEDAHIKLFNFYHTMILYEFVIGEILEFTKEHVIELRRTTIYLLDLIFPDETLLQKMTELMSLRDDQVCLLKEFYRIKDIQQTCYSSLGRVKKCDIHGVELEDQLSSLYEKEYLHVSLVVRQASLRVRNAAVCKVVADHYISTRNELLKAVVNFVHAFAQAVAEFGIHPRKLGKLYELFENSMYVYKGMCEELDAAVLETRARAKMAALNYTTTAVPVLEACLYAVYTSFTSTKFHRYDKMHVEWVLARLPLYDEIIRAFPQNVQQNIIANRSKNETPRLKNRTPLAKKSYFEGELVIFDHLKVPEKDILSLQELKHLCRAVAAR